MGRFVFVWIALALVVATFASPDGDHYGDGHKADGTRGVGGTDHSRGGLYEKSGATSGASGGYGHGAGGILAYGG
nr:uncharacterized protein LOC128674686 isoform X2 [Plodia interpunctella]